MYHSVRYKMFINIWKFTEYQWTSINYNVDKHILQKTTFEWMLLCDAS